jgi:lipopolysaccharide transport system ATP-binding protein
MSDVILSVENVSKLYRLGTVGTGTFGGDVQRFWKTKILGQEDPFLKVGQTNDRTSKEKAEFVWALQDINFEVKRGEVLGIIGKNGAGKSTLLKLLSRITSPTTGSVKSAGRMASLLEVGTGFHPELTGRENVFLNGAILGMSKKEIQSKFDEIVDFSGCDLYIDTPTKRYSSGMKVRLGFAVAAFLDPEILVIDEVLAVGDAEFQKKAIGKMQNISNSEGRTILFVSHNMEAVRTLCSRALILHNGKIIDDGNVDMSIGKYLLKDEESSLNYKSENIEDTINLLSVDIIRNLDSPLSISEEFIIRIGYFLRSENDAVSTSIHLNQSGIKVFCVGSASIKQESGYYYIDYNIPKNLLNNKTYSIDVYLIFNSNQVMKEMHNIVTFSLHETVPRSSNYLGEIAGVVRPNIDTKLIKIYQ